MWGLSPSDNNAAINAYKASLGITNPCAGTEGGGPEAIDIVIAGQNFLGYPTYCVVCPDKSMYFDACYPPSVACFDGVIADCPTLSIAAAFSSDLSEVCQNESINFEDISTGAITSWNWTFEGGNPATSTEQNPMVTYATAGIFDVTLEISDGTETNSVTVEDYVTSNALPETMLEPFAEVCINTPEFELTGGTPAGGEYTGDGVTDGWFNPEVAGVGTHTITYTYSDDNDCVNAAEETIYVDECVGINESSEQLMQLFPNPTTGVFEMELTYEGKFTVQVISVLGDVVYEVEATANGNYSNSIDMSGMESGVYFVSLKSNDETIVKKLQLLNQ
ncbi:T9SS type A sorting domain-containing protein [Desulfosarcina sp.]|nr:T9SS type A sorting domain-containing protein [Desulfosarcina sp.]